LSEQRSYDDFDDLTAIVRDGCGKPSSRRIQALYSPRRHGVPWCLCEISVPSVVVRKNSKSAFFTPVSCWKHWGVFAISYFFSRPVSPWWNKTSLPPQGHCLNRSDDLVW